MTVQAVLLRGAALAAVGALTTGCLAVAATKAAVGVTGAVVGTGVKATGAVVGAVIPGGDGGEEKGGR